jgi:DNA-binding NtrC family response regulator
VVIFSTAHVAGDSVYLEAPTLSLGRSPDCDLFVNDPAMSRRHAAVAFEPGRVTIRDLGSHNGTFVDGIRVSPDGSEVPEDGMIRCGDTLLLHTADPSGFSGWREWGRDGPLIGGPAMRAVRAEVAALAASDLEVLVLGETGTGKEIVAAELHAHSQRRGRLVALDCSTVPETLCEAELFGALKGSFTGSTADRLGLFRAAHGGTLLLDEVGDLPLALQPKLLRAVEQRAVRPVGGDEPVAVNVRLVAATNRDLAEEVERGSFRLDLFHRLNGACIRIPPLRSRREDITLLSEHFVRDGGAGRPLGISADAMERLVIHGWPGNVRELGRVVREAAARATSAGRRAIAVEDLRAELRGLDPSPRQRADLLQRVRDALRRADGNVTRAAAELGIHRSRVYTLLKERGMTIEQVRGHS